MKDFSGSIQQASIKIQSKTARMLAQTLTSFLSLYGTQNGDVERIRILEPGAQF
jgi:hypothetical protein